MTDVAETYPVVEEPPRRRGRKALIVLIVLVALLAGLLVAADRVAVGVAETAIAEQAKKESAKRDITVSETPDVSIEGFPFLTQVARGRYEKITINVVNAEGPVQGKPVRIPRLELVAQGVKAPLSALRSGQGEIRAEKVDGTGVITYDTMAKFISQPGVVLGEQNGKLAMTAPVDILGAKLTVKGTGTLTVNEKGQVELKFDSLTADGLPNLPLAKALLSSYAKRFSIKVPVPQLPYGLTVREVKALPEGLQISASANDVPLNG